MAKNEFYYIYNYKILYNGYKIDFWKLKIFAKYSVPFEIVMGKFSDSKNQFEKSMKIRFSKVKYQYF